MIWLWTILFYVGQLVGWCLNFFSLPGNWILVALIGVYAWLGPETGRLHLGWPTVAAALGLAILGEGIEFVAAGASARKAGGTRRAGWFAMAGSLLGSIVGAMIGIPIPVLGPVIGCVLFACLGAMGGALFGEWTAGKTWEEMRPVGNAAFWGRLFGLAAKIACGLGIITASIVGMLG